MIKKWCKPHFLMQIYLIVFSGGSLLPGHTVIVNACWNNLPCAKKRKFLIALELESNFKHYYLINTKTTFTVGHLLSVIGSKKTLPIQINKKIIIYELKLIRCYINSFFIALFCPSLREVVKKFFFFSGPAPPPSSLVATFF